MSESWANRQRNTNHLVRLVAPFVLDSKKVEPRQLYGLCKLTWVTRNPKSEDASYIESTKIPALSDIFREDFSGCCLEQVAERISKILGDPNAIGAIERHTGFTNFYSAYRNSARNWVELNSSRLKRLFKSAYALSSDDDGLRLIETVESLKGIGKPNETDSKIPASNLLTPVFFSLDQRLRFPLINGNEGVQHVLRTMKESTSSLKVQYTRMNGNVWERRNPGCCRPRSTRKGRCNPSRCCRHTGHTRQTGHYNKHSAPHRSTHRRRVPADSKTTEISWRSEPHRPSSVEGFTIV